MDDLSKKISDLLSSPDGMEKIRSAMASLGMDGGGEEAPAPPAESEPEGGGLNDALQSLLAGLGGQQAEKPAPREGGGGLPDLSVLAKVAPLMAGMNQEDENTALLKALRPYLHGDREKRLDDAIQILKFMRIIPLLQDKGPAG